MTLINYFWTLPPVLIVAWLLQRLFLAMKLHWNDQWSLPLLKILTVVVAVVYFLLGLYKYYAMQCGLWDFGIYDSMLSIAANDGIWMRDYRGGWFDHFSPVVLLLVPFYKLYDHPVWLIALQAAAMAAAAPLLYLTARRYFRQGAFPFLVTAMYCLNPYYSRMALYDFHIECLFAPLLFAAFFCYARNRFNWMTLLLAAAPLIKEDFVVPAAAAGLLLLSRRRTRFHGGIVFAAALFWTFFVLKIYYPHILGTAYWHYGRFELFAPTFQETAHNVLVMAGRIFTRNTLAVILSVVLPFALLPLINWRAALLFWFPTLAIQLISGFEHQQLLMSHYSSAVLAVTPLAALWGARSLRIILRRRGCYNNQLRRKIYAGMSAMVIVMHVAYCELPLGRYYNYVTGCNPDVHGGLLSLPFNPAYWHELLYMANHAETFRRAAAKLPIRPDDDIVCQNDVGEEFLRRGRVHSLPGPEGGEKPEFYLFDKINHAGHDRPEAINALLETLLRDPEYQLEYNADTGILFFLRKDVATRK